MKHPKFTITIETVTHEDEVARRGDSHMLPGQARLDALIIEVTEGRDNKHLSIRSMVASEDRLEPAYRNLTELIAYSLRKRHIDLQLELAAQ
jgi:hypothetical protein